MSVCLTQELHAYCDLLVLCSPCSPAEDGQLLYDITYLEFYQYKRVHPHAAESAAACTGGWQSSLAQAEPANLLGCPGLPSPEPAHVSSACAIQIARISLLWSSSLQRRSCIPSRHLRSEDFHAQQAVPRDQRQQLLLCPAFCALRPDWQHDVPARRQCVRLRALSHSRECSFRTWRCPRANCCSQNNRWACVNRKQAFIWMLLG